MARLLPATWRRPEAGPRGTFMDIHRELDRLLEDFQRWPGMAMAGSGMMAGTPAMDMRETEDGVEITAELPGVNEADIDLSLDNDMLTLKGRKRSERREEEKGWHLEERSYGSFQRTIMLPFSCDPATVRASFENGLLRIMLPRPKEARVQSHKIPIGHGESEGGAKPSNPAEGNGPRKPHDA